MSKIYLVRHGKAAKGWGMDSDPGLDELGHSQARATAEELAPLGPLDIISSPMARARETARPLAEIWGLTPRIETQVTEIPSPDDSTNRIGWLESVMAAKWPNLQPQLQSWRSGVIEALCSLSLDTVVFTHFIAINVAVGQANGDDRVVNFLPDNGSVTIIEANESILNVIQQGLEAKTEIR